MKKRTKITANFLVCIVLAITLLSFANKKNKPVIIAYVGGFRGLIHTDSIDVWRLSHINYAFVDIKDNRAWLHNEATDTINLRKLSELKNLNPDLKILISIGGWSWSKNFSDAVLTDTSNKYFVTTAVGGSQDYIEHTEMDKVQQYADYINVMSYDYADSHDSISGHHTNLYISSADTAQYSAHRSIQAFIATGVPPEKIVIGIAFYGKGWQMQSSDNKGLYRPALQPARGGGFTYLKDSIINKN